MSRFVRALVLATLVFAAPAFAQKYPPTFDFASILKSYFDDETGLLQLDDFVVGFAPEGPFKGEVAVIDSENTVLGRFPFYEDKNVEDGVFARVRVEGPAEVTITKQGIYNLIFLVAGKPVTRFPFVVREVTSGDEFKPGASYRFDGLWRSLAYLTITPNNDLQIPTLNFWVGGLDLPDGATKDLYQASLLRDGAVVAYSKKSLGNIPTGHFEYTSIGLFHPHVDREAGTAKFFSMADFTDGTYELRVTRQSDGESLRSFDVTVAGGKFQQLPRAVLGYEPALDFIPPRVAKRNVTVFEMEEVFWLEDLD